MDRIRTQARELRNNPTNTERVLWRQIRSWQLDGYKFRRQQPLGPYIVDFVCLEKRVVVEVDGGQHGDQVDAERDNWLRDQGFVVLRFWNNEVLKNMDGVREVILRNLQSTPYLSPSPQGGRKNSRKIRGKTSSTKRF
jgi:very-short-patch-repair endonuclease